MRTSQYFLTTLKESPADAEIISHQLMLRAGLIRKISSGIYTWLPLGLRVLKKIENIVREEMNKSGALELLMPSVQPAELWQETGRWEKYGNELLKINDRHEREFCFGPTHEEIITEIARREIHSYKQLPLNFYQIQTKFRDEIRPRFGVMRSREFLMKDAYSFHLTKESLQKTYQVMYETYCNIFNRLGLKFRPVLADTGSIGGNFSHEFQVLADAGEDLIAYSDGSDYAANIEKAEALAPQVSLASSNNAMQCIDTPGQYTIKALVDSLKVDIKKTVKTLLVAGKETSMVALILRGDHDLNPLKAEKLAHVASPLRFVSEEEIINTIGCRPGSIGPVNLKIPVIVDRDAAIISDFVCGANVDDKHFINVNWQRDVKLPEIADLRTVVEGDLSPDGKGHLQLTRGIEVGHIFQLGDKYSSAMNACVLDENGQSKVLQMGCYGIGVSRIAGAAIEQNHDEFGIIWTDAMTPFHVTIVPIGYHKSTLVRETAEKLYLELTQAGFDVLLDDREERPGVMFADMDLIGIPHRIVLGERGLAQNNIEYKNRREKQAENIEIREIVNYLKQKIKNSKQK